MAIRNEFSSIVYISSKTEELGERERTSLRHTALKHYGHFSLFEMSKELFEKFMELQFGNSGLEIEEGSLMVIRKENPVILEYFGDIGNSETLWDYFNAHKFRKWENFSGFNSNDNKIHAVLVDSFCSQLEREYFHIWDSHREASFGESRVLKVRAGDSINWQERLDIANDCAVVFYKKVNSFLSDKFKLDPNFIGRFSLDDFTRRLDGGRESRYIMSQSYEGLGEDAEYRLIGGNLDSTYQQLGVDSAILFYNSVNRSLDESMKGLHDATKGKCQTLSRGNEGTECDPESQLVQRLKRAKTSIFSFDLDQNDIPSFVIDHHSSLLIFIKGREDPMEFRLKNKTDLYSGLEKYLQEKLNEEGVETDL